MINNFDIDQKEAREIFEDMIFSQIVKDPTPQLIKKAVLLGGQPGSGKSSLARELLKNRPEIIFINGDDLRPYHPKYYFYLKNNNTEAADLTQAVCNYWIEMLINECAKRKLSMIIEGTMRKKSVPLETAHMLKKLNYLIDVAVVSAPYEVSKASIQYRYQALKKMGISTRYTKQKSHDEAFHNIEGTLDALIDSGLCEEFYIFQRHLGEFIQSTFQKEQKKEILNEFTIGRNREIEKDEIMEIDLLSKNEFKILIK